MWSMAANKGGLAFITTVENYLNAGWSLSIISTGGGIPDEIKSRSKCVVEKHYHFADSLMQSNLKLFRFWGKFLRVFLCNKFYYRECKKRIKQDGTKDTILYAYEVAGVLVAKMLSRKYGVPVVTRFQGTVISNVENTFLNRLRHYPHFEALSTSADLIIMTNDGTQGLSTLKRLKNNSKINFWMNGVSIPELISSDKREELRERLGFKGKYVFLTVSRLVAWKKVERAILAFSAARDSIPNASLHIIGDGASRKYLEDYSSKLGVSNCVCFHGAIEQKQVFDYMVACDVFLSLYDLSNVGNPLLEAMSSGKTIITLDNGDTSMFIKNMETGILISPNHLEEIPEHMVNLYNNKQLSMNLGNSARKFAENNFWSWEQRMSEELKAVEGLLEQ